MVKSDQVGDSLEDSLLLLQQSLEQFGALLCLDGWHEHDFRWLDHLEQIGLASCGLESDEFGQFPLLHL